MTSRERLSASVEANLLAAGRRAVADGRAETLSAWVNDALRMKADHDSRMLALDEYLNAYESEHGVITEDEMGIAARRAHQRSVTVQGAVSA